MVIDKANKKIKLNRKAGTFLICFILSSILWLFSALSKENNISIQLPVKYYNFPKDRTVSNKLPDVLDLDIKTNGFGTLAFDFGKTADTFLINVQNMKYLKGNDFFITMHNTRQEKLAKHLGRGIKLVKVDPDTLYFSFSPKSTRTLPVKINTAFTFDKDYELNGVVKVEPSEVKISGASTLIEKVKQIETQPIKLDELSKTTTLKIPLKLDNDLKQLELSTQEVTITIPVEKFTEGELELPVTAINVPKKKKVKLFPDKIKVKYQVSMNEFEKIKPEQFKVVADFSKMPVDKKNKIKVELTESPKNLKQVKLSSSKVEYILIK